LAVNLRISSLRKKSRKMNYPPSQTFNYGWDTLRMTLITLCGFALVPIEAGPGQEEFGLQG
jgi:hypothetical protein